MGQTNAEWHGKNKMPKNPSFAERVAWHTAHVKHCACRSTPRSLHAAHAKKHASRHSSG